jgi:hypothetical protein
MRLPCCLCACLVSASIYQLLYACTEILYKYLHEIYIKFHSTVT